MERVTNTAAFDYEASRRHPGARCSCSARTRVPDRGRLRQRSPPFFGTSDPRRERAEELLTDRATARSPRRGCGHDARGLLLPPADVFAADMGDLFKNYPRSNRTARERLIQSYLAPTGSATTTPGCATPVAGWSVQASVPPRPRSAESLFVRIDESEEAPGDRTAVSLGGRSHLGGLIRRVIERHPETVAPGTPSHRARRDRPHARQHRGNRPGLPGARRGDARQGRADGDRRAPIAEPAIPEGAELEPEHRTDRWPRGSVVIAFVDSAGLLVAAAMLPGRRSSEGWSMKPGRTPSIPKHRGADVHQPDVLPTTRTRPALVTEVESGTPTRSRVRGPRTPFSGAPSPRPTHPLSQVPSRADDVQGGVDFEWIDLATGSRW